jgi:hypothetical protein
MLRLNTVPYCTLVRNFRVVDPHWFKCGSGFNFYIGANPDPRSQTNAGPDSDPGQTLKSQKIEYLHEKYNLVGRYGNRSKNLPTIRRYKSHFERQTISVVEPEP